MCWWKNWLKLTIWCLFGSQLLITILLKLEYWLLMSMFAENIETVDDILTFADLGSNLKSRGYHVANISSLDFSTKNGIGGCLRGLLRQLLMVDVEVSRQKSIMMYIIDLNYIFIWCLSFTITFAHGFGSKAAEMSLLASWYNGHGKYENPVVVIIEDLERCSGTLLSDFINMLRYCHLIVQSVSF